MQGLIEQLNSLTPSGLTGSVVRTEGMAIAVAGFPAPIGGLVEVERQAGNALRAEVIGFRDGLTIAYPFQDVQGVRHGNRVRLIRTTRYLPVGVEMLGRIFDAHGNPVDGRPAPALNHRAMLTRRPPPPVQRPRIDTSLSTGIRAIDGLLTCGYGQRMGVFSGSGVGKSVTLGMIARYSSADIIVIGLIGERGREVNEFVERDLGVEGLARSVVVVATSDEPALTRVQSAMSATAIAEHFRDQGKNVLLIMDSLTRFAMAQREIGLAAGEPPTTKGYPPSVFAMLPRLVERTGRSELGSITAIYSVLVEGDDTNEPISDAVRGLIDGHTVLSRRLANKGHYPAVDVLESISRLMPEVVSREHYAAAQQVRELLAAYRDHEDLISIGAYRPGANPTVDSAIALQNDLNQFLRQRIDENSTVKSARQILQLIAAKAEALSQQAAMAPAVAQAQAAQAQAQTQARSQQTPAPPAQAQAAPAPPTA